MSLSSGACVVRIVLVLCLFGCGAAAVPHRFVDFLGARGVPEDAVGLCEPAHGLVLYSQPPVVTTCLESAVQFNVIGWAGRPLLLLRSTAGLVDVRSPDELLAAVAPITSASAAVGYLFAAWHWRPGRLLDIPRNANGKFIGELLQTYPPVIRKETNGFTIDWPMIQMPPGGCRQDLYRMTTHIARDGTIREPVQRLVAAALTRICY